MNEDSMYREMEQGEVNLVCMPIFHVAGTNMGLAGMVTGQKNIIIPEVDPTLILNLEQENPACSFCPSSNTILVSIRSSFYRFFFLKDSHIRSFPITDDTLIKAMELMKCDSGKSMD